MKPPTSSGRHTRVATLSLLALAIALNPANVFAGVLTVTDNTDTGTGCLRWCIQQAQPGDEIRFAPHLDGLPIVVVGGDLVIDTSIKITGRGPDRTIVQGCYGCGRRVVSVRPGTDVLISGVALRDGKSSGILNGGRLRLEHSVVSGNVAVWGGGIYNAGVLVLDHVTVKGNWASRGGGIYNFGTLTVENSTVEGNWIRAGRGGGIYNTFGTLVVDRSTIAGNRGDTRGGGVLVAGGAVTIRNSTITGNSATLGGGIFSYDFARLVVENSTIAGNGGGGGVRAFGPRATIRDSIVAEHGAGGDCDGPLTSLGHNLDGDGSCGFDRASDLPATPPMLGPLQDNGGPTLTRVPLAGSPVIDRGWCDPGTDQRGVPRPLDGNRDGLWVCDIGAVEYVPYRFQVLGEDGTPTVFEPDAD
jgi:hypothetical protein